MYNIESFNVIGIDLGGTNTVMGVIDVRGQILATDSIKTAKYVTAEDFAAALLPKLNHLIAQFGGIASFKGIGIGAPNGNYYSGCIEDAPNIKWAKGRKVPLAKMISYGTGVPCSLTNDANAAAIGEMTYGAARGMKDFIMITLGTGVGSGIVANGQLIYGHDGFAGELGHVTVVKDGRLCGCGRKGCLETYASATGVARTAKEIVQANKVKTLLSEIPIDDITSKDVYDAAVKGDKVAISVFEETGKILGEAFANFINFSSPEAIVLFGGLTKAGDYLVKPIEKYMEENLMHIFKGKTKILLSQLKESDAAVLGASALAWESK